jgi:predicted nucleotidyltransferase
MSGLEALFPSRTLVKVLALLLLNPEQQYYQAEVAEQTQEALLKVQKALKRAVDSGFITQSKQGKMVFYQANSAQPGFEELKNLFLKTVALAERLREPLLVLSDKIQAAFIFGSYAQGTATSRSDIDVFILGTLSLREIAHAFGDVSEKIGREVNPVVYSLADFRERQDQRFIQEMVICPKIWLVGNDNEFKRLAE